MTSQDNDEVGGGGDDDAAESHVSGSDAVRIQEQLLHDEVAQLRAQVRRQLQGGGRPSLPGHDGAVARGASEMSRSSSISGILATYRDRLAGIRDQTRPPHVPLPPSPRPSSNQQYVPPAVTEDSDGTRQQPPSSLLLQETQNQQHHPPEVEHGGSNDDEILDAFRLLIYHTGRPTMLDLQSNYMKLVTAAQNRTLDPELRDLWNAQVNRAAALWFGTRRGINITHLAINNEDRRL